MTVLTFLLCSLAILAGLWEIAPRPVAVFVPRSHLRTVTNMRTGEIRRVNVRTRKPICRSATMPSRFAAASSTQPPACTQGAKRMRCTSTTPRNR